MDNSKEKTPEWLVPGYPKLKGEVGAAAVNGQLVHYPMVVRNNSDTPVINQVCGLVSFAFFKETRKLSNGKPVYGFFKIRGNYADPATANKNASDIIKEQDSKYRVLNCPVGYWLPLTEETAFIKEQLDVNCDVTDENTENMPHLRDQAAKDNEKKQQQIMRELREREEDLRSKDVYDDMYTLDFFTMKIITLLRIKENIAIKEKEKASLESKEVETQKLLQTLYNKNPKYKECWVDNYNEERKKGGVPPFTPEEKFEKELDVLLPTL